MYSTSIPPILVADKSGTFSTSTVLEYRESPVYTVLSKLYTAHLDYSTGSLGMNTVSNPRNLKPVLVLMYEYEYEYAIHL